MKKKNSKQDFFDLLLLSYRDQILHGVVKEVSPNGMWITSASGKELFITCTDLELMRDFLSNFF